ncbi:MULTISPECIES: bifunctional methylenetetrahydrofolate dehydrogenase/methenyltetrahydrofolate cyclohydrolase FolD [Prochlorococcus]|uniref:bifunctional methylenetetrahydrofolate dehydrogenase/methenyltetrahydrofolate cyclohydrolase FolD n=1 Tax=Prochlorococcus TaxID=1218 RepID=UPI000533757B|nr:MULTISPECIES: bifunctional methylenetetrahydrofolate dehydrogenase/methenyltetrahydrofolate cyclohydrolase FolD [Prochlorococcus]KGG12227.1 Methylenetetrahydrofolate dehydrogenase (NADP+) [Prochlorococcus sp. MIT 0601]
MVNKLDGKKLANEIELRINQAITDGINESGRPPGLAVIRVGDDPASGIYVSNKEKACKRVGVKSFGCHFKANTSAEEIVQQIRKLNNNVHVDGILLQLPLPSHLNSEELLKHIDPEKDADGLHTINLGRLIKGELGPRSCTPAGVMALLAKNQIRLKGAKAVVIGRSILVGKPMGLMLQAANATVTLANSYTVDLPEITTQADLLVVAAGKPGLIGIEHVRKNSIVVDIGIHRVPNKEQAGHKLCGDVRFEEIQDHVAAITPVPGGVGPMTIAMLLVNTVIGWQQRCGLSLSLGDLLP